jgi:hypothetical protein
VSNIQDGKSGLGKRRGGTIETAPMFASCFLLTSRKMLLLVPYEARSS